MEVSLKEYITGHMEDKTTITIPIVLRNKLWLLKKKGEAMYNVIEKLLALYEKVEIIRNKKNKNLTKNSEIENNRKIKNKQKTIKTTATK